MTAINSFNLLHSFVIKKQHEKNFIIVVMLWMFLRMKYCLPGIRELSLVSAQNSALLIRHVRCLVRNRTQLFTVLLITGIYHTSLDTF